MIAIARGQQQQPVAADGTVAVGERTRDPGPVAVGERKRPGVDQREIISRTVALDEGELHGGAHLGLDAADCYSAVAGSRATGPPIAWTVAQSRSIVGAKLGRAWIAAT